MPLDAELRPIVDLVNSIDAPTPCLEEVPTLRESYAALCAAFTPGPDGQAVEVEGIAIPNGAAPMALRVYRAAAPGTGVVRPGALVWFHGGGWVIGDLDTHDTICRELCAASGATVISVDYRCAPEHTFPAAHSDASRALEWIVAHSAELEIDPSRIAVGGDSAGGHLATVVARRARDAGGPTLALQVLVYPVTDLHSDPAQYPSRQENAVGYVLTSETMDFFRDTYTPEPGDRSEADASPILAEDLSGLAPALVITSEFDPLRDEGDAYATRLAEAGVATEHSRYDGATHMFLQLSSTSLAQRAITQVADALRRYLG